MEKLRRSGYDVMCANAERFELGRRFDVVVAGELIEHLDNPGLFLECVKRHLRDDGIFILTTPNLHAAYLFKKALLGRTKPTEHTHGHTVETLRTTLERHGYDLLELGCVPTEQTPLRLSRFLHRFLPSRFQPVIFAMAKLKLASRSSSKGSD